MDLVHAQNIKAIELHKPGSAGTSGIKTFIIQKKIGATWADVQSFTSPQTPSNNNEQYTLSKTLTARYIAIWVVSNYGNTYTSFWSIKVKVWTPAPTFTKLRIGASYKTPTNIMLIGVVQHFKVWRSALSDAHIAQVYSGAEGSHCNSPQSAACSEGAFGGQSTLGWVGTNLMKADYHFRLDGNPKV